MHNPRMLESVTTNAIPVVLGIPNAGRWRMWSDDEEFSYFIDDPMLEQVLGWGRIASTEVAPAEHREIGLLNPVTATVSLHPRAPETFIANRVPFPGHRVQCSLAEQRPQAGLHTMQAVLMSAIFDAAMTRNSVTVEPGGCGRPSGSGPMVALEVHRHSEWDEHISLIARPHPARSELWQEGTRDDVSGWTEIAVPLHGSGMNHAVRLIIEAAADWGHPPEALVLTFARDPRPADPPPVTEPRS